MMYEFDYAIDESIVGTFPQGGGMVKNYNFNSSTSVDIFGEFKGRHCDFKPDLRYKLDKDAIATDFLSGCLGPGGDLVISQKAYDLITKFNLGPVQLFEASVEQKKHEVRVYYKMHFIYSLESEIEFNKSSFWYADRVVESIDSYAAYKKYLEDYDHFGITRSEKTVVKSTLINNLDLFVIGLFDQRIYISKRLKLAIFQAGLTGMILKKAKTLVCI